MTMWARVDLTAPPLPNPAASGPDVTASWISPENLDGDHLAALTRALSNVLSTDRAEYTYAQLIDGLPTRDSELELRSFYPAEEQHPVYKHEKLCDGARETARRLRSQLSLSDLRFDPLALQGYQDASPQSRNFLLRLFELVAISIHQVAVRSFEMDEGRHREEYLQWWESWRERHRHAEGIEQWHAVAFPPVPFYHTQYQCFDQYPKGKAYMVGYWAEAKILGGVAWFDRGASDLECNDISLHGDFIDEPKTLCPLTAAQWDAVVTFLTADLATGSPPASPFPLHATAQNLPRYTPYFAVKYQHIFRNRFDLKLPGRYERPHPRAVSAVDYPEKADHEWVVEHSLHKTFGRPIDEEEMERRLDVLRRCQPGNPYSMAPLPEEIARGEGEEDQAKGDESDQKDESSQAASEPDETDESDNSSSAAVPPAAVQINDTPSAVARALKTYAQSPSARCPPAPVIRVGSRHLMDLEPKVEQLRASVLSSLDAFASRERNLRRAGEQLGLVKPPRGGRAGAAAAAPKGKKRARDDDDDDNDDDDDKDEPQQYPAAKKRRTNNGNAVEPQTQQQQTLSLPLPLPLPPNTFFAQRLDTARATIETTRRLRRPDREQYYERCGQHLALVEDLLGAAWNSLCGSLGLAWYTLGPIPGDVVWERSIGVLFEVVRRVKAREEEEEEEREQGEREEEQQQQQQQ
ncbi:hypothetical protein VFPFJ_00164 [Purpureocillium lilacinum]|uniref:Uncharacterized protein n=1 Tax=Purpureocillium lilacinum TaxID=33203 RepID=A0A179HU89_PURLI|nr:hypothetical protein VFPFJ_00164 [Purpureocillium lilacinum]OAQ94056.1 hypothetical protein VFPFJ_00164 [Purpureocillium lilacinum]